MSIDMSQFYQVFFDEAAEHLASMESLLLALDLDAPDADQLNAIFRAAHSIKGGSGTFGFTDMASVTHILETLLDRVRKHEITLTHDMVDAFLQAGDALRGLLTAHQNGSIADEAASIAICIKLEKLTEGSPELQVEHVIKGTPSSVSGDALATSQGSIYQIQFTNSQSAFPTETHLNNLLAALSNVGMINHQLISRDSVTLSLTTPKTDVQLREIFSFFLDMQHLSITEVDGNPGKDEDPGYGFFAADASESEAEKEQGYGFFEAPEVIRSGIENAQGYGFFEAPETIQSGFENAQGYGFFTEVESRPNAPDHAMSARQDDVPGRRATDRAAVTAVGENSIRVGVGKVDNLVNLVGELVITQAMLTETVSSLDTVTYERLLSGMAQLDRNTRDLQESVMSVRMMPISLVFSRFQRVVRDNAVKLNKKVQLKIIGENTELDKGLIEKISDPITHLVRNSLDHGIELPAERIAQGKDPQGTITLRAAHQGGSIILEVSDDGAGLNRERILAKAKEKGMPVSDGMSDAEVWQIIFAPGFSTAAVVTDVSGRGVGMDVVKKNIESISGRIDIHSVHGQGSSMTIRLPLTLAILDGLSIAVGDHIYIVPLGYISESLQPNPGDIKEISGQGEVVQVRGEYLPLIALYKLFNIQPRVTNPAEGILVLLEAEGKKIALFVDELVGQHQVVIKSLETNYRKVPGVSGATIMGDGRVAMIIDVGALVKWAV
ncbi:MAG: chemotaxis protein CheW [Gallionella sp.]|jgi:two-component system chemotaxis sensor kinase CheA